MTRITSSSAARTEIDAAKASTLRRHVATIAAHFRRHARQGTKAPTTQTMEFAFETSCEHGDAVAGILMRRAERCPDLRRGLEAWDVYTNDSWLASQSRMAGRSEAEMIAAACRAG
jgi:hypothetical protein